jgi:DNA polymerase III alpha subunit (gram-positive type)
MPNYYLDIETTGLNPEKDQILTIQYQKLDRNTGRAIENLTILKAWESSEKEIIKQFLENTEILEDYAFSFIPVGYNLSFEHNFLKKRAEIYCLPQVDILNNPFIDLRAVGILMNEGEFKGSGLDKLTGKEGTGRLVPIWFENTEYDKIIKYIELEAKEFIRFNSWLYNRMPNLLKLFKAEFNIK